MKVYIHPAFRGADEGDGGIRRVVEAQKLHLPKFDIQIVEHMPDADLLNIHAGSLVETGAPIVSSIHGLYWTAEEEWGQYGKAINQMVIDVLRRCEAVTAPTEWVADSLRRGMLHDPLIIPHGIETDEWEPGDNKGYVVWNKTRVDPVCDPRPVARLAAMAKDTQFVTTFGRAQSNIEVTGKMPYDDMRGVIADAGVYLCTPRETFGIGTLEAMACAVPVLGWDWGGQRDIVPHMEAGYLAEPGNYEDLLTGLRYCQENRERLGAAAREIALRYTWESAAGQYADLFRSVGDGAAKEAARPLVSVVIPCYNQAHWLPDAVKSVLNQGLKDVEVVVVDDHSPDNTMEVAQALAAEDPRVKPVRPDRNLYLAGARNFGIRNSTGKYIVPLDADDMLAKDALSALVLPMEKDRGIHITYGGMRVIREDGTEFVSEWPPEEFDWHAQRHHRNQLPYCSMYRREVWERTGGYRERCVTAEDADFWTRVTSFGFRVGRATRGQHLIKREHADSMGFVQEEPDWTRWFGWAQKHENVPFGCDAPPPDLGPAWPVKSYETPAISIIIPVGPDHKMTVRTALDSLMAQTRDDWECIVVLDYPCQEGFDPTWGFPWARTLATPESGSGPAVARNIGLASARGRWVVFLDADDYLEPTFLEHTTRAVEECDEFAWTHWWGQDEDGKIEFAKANGQGPDTVLERMRHAVTALYPRAAIEAVGGFDEDAPWEDWDMQIGLRVQGWCGVEIPSAEFVYRYHLGSLRERAYENKEEWKPRVLAKWGDFIKGAKPLMACRGCGGTATAPSAPIGAPMATNQPAPRPAPGVNDPILIEYIGNVSGPVKYRRPGAVYRFGRDRAHHQQYVHAAHAGWFLERSNEFRRVDIAPGQPMAAPAPTAPQVVAHETGAPAAPRPAAPPPDQPLRASDLEGAVGSFTPTGAPEVAAPTPSHAVIDTKEMTVAAVRKAAKEWNAEELRQALNAESAGLERKTAIQALEKAIAEKSAEEVPA